MVWGRGEDIIEVPRSEQTNGKKKRHSGQQKRDGERQRGDYEYEVRKEKKVGVSVRETVKKKGEVLGNFKRNTIYIYKTTSTKTNEARGSTGGKPLPGDSPRSPKLGDGMLALPRASTFVPHKHVALA
jgi:hypothetical protein